MTNMIKFSIFSIALVLFLSITIKDKPIFSHIYKVISPATIAAQKATESLFDSSVESTKDYTKKLFHNSVPKMKDTVKAKVSAPFRKEAAPQESISSKDRQELDDLIKTHKR
jgi:hypothetical protein